MGIAFPALAKIPTSRINPRKMGHAAAIFPRLTYSSKRLLLNYLRVDDCFIPRALPRPRFCARFVPKQAQSDLTRRRPEATWQSSALNPDPRL